MGNCMICELQLHKSLCVYTYIYKGIKIVLPVDSKQLHKHWRTKPHLDNKFALKSQGLVYPVMSCQLEVSALGWFC